MENDHRTSLPSSTKSQNQGTNKQPLINFGRYNLLQELGRGGMGIVYKAYDTKLKSVVALKIIMSREKEYLERFFIEATIIAKLNHPHIIRFYECGGTPRPHFTMEYIEGVTLSNLIKERSITPSQLVDLMIPLCEALHFAHQNNVMHRDIKPGNIMITNDNIVKIMDFGLAKTSDATQQLSRSGQILGTVHYMAPEQVLGNADYASDIYSLGASMYEALTFRTVYQGALDVNIIVQVTDSTPIPLRQLNPDISPYLEAICLKCLRKNPQKRYNNFAQLAQELRNYKENKPIIARKYSSWDVVNNFIAKHKIICGSLLLIFVILITALVVTTDALRYAEKERVEADTKSKEAQEATLQKEKEKQKTRLALNKVMKALSYAIEEHRSLQQDQKFAELFSEIFLDIEEYGENQDWSFIKGYITSKIGKSQKSIEYFSKRIQQTPNSSYAYLNRSLVYTELGEHKKALSDINRAVEMDANNAQFWHWRGYIYFQINNYQKAAKDYKKSIMLAPKKAQGYHSLAYLYYRQKKYHLAIENFNAAIRCDQNSASAYNSRGLVYFVRKQYEVALRDYKKAIVLDPEMTIAYVNSIRVYLQQNKYQQALQYLAELPPSAMTYTCRAMVYVHLGKEEEVLANLNRAIEMKTSLLHPYTLRLQIYLKQKQYAKALEDANNAIRLAGSYSYKDRWLQQEKSIDFYSSKPTTTNSNIALSYYNRGAVYDKMRKWPLAITDFSKAISIDANFTEAYLGRSLSYRRDKKYPQALQDINKCITLQPQNANHYYIRGKVYTYMNNDDLAKLDFDKSISLDSQHAKSYYWRGRMYDYQEQHELAIADYSTCIIYDPQHKNAYFRRGNVYERQQKYQMAIKDWQASAKLESDYTRAIKVKIANATRKMNGTFVAKQHDSIKSAVTYHYNNEGEWAGVYKVDVIEKMEMQWQKKDLIKIHAQYTYAPIVAGKNSGIDRRYFILRKRNFYYAVIEMGGAGSGN
ncbi:protein kinase domain-containing protein [Candidatus Uabimicrobium amorphum]|uniref:non-specific serine/threonine protein kinase n=1 Tax=Uabimicrobium amorphum TaxID=2596890 RepID=A0A5S9IRS7_UABAM|nr:serine/threonine-protein kinase [Candidatus Uabimicrobium amorphum]BBM86361.1 serine/threonine protein kinase [Candidatus Uabimicrobium amorphum]